MSQNFAGGADTTYRHDRPRAWRFLEQVSQGGPFEATALAADASAERKHVTVTAVELRVGRPYHPGGKLDQLRIHASHCLNNL